MKRELPTINIEGTDFLIDVNTVELREKTNPQNTISFFDMREIFKGYRFDYSLKDKNIPGLFDKEKVTVYIPELVALDPEGMALKYHLPVEDIHGKTDFDLMVDQKAYDMRLNKGMLPTLDIDGHTFFVDIRMDMLRPKDDFLSEGIVFRQVDHYFSEEVAAYVIPYNPQTHAFEELDYDKITQFPKDLIAVQFPRKRDLDPIGWNREMGLDITDSLKKIGVKLHLNAQIIPWQATIVPEIIKENLETQRKLKREAKVKQRQSPVPNRKKGRSI